MKRKLDIADLLNAECKRVDEEAANNQTERFINGLVADYLDKHFPKLGKKFKRDHTLGGTQGHSLEDVVSFKIGVKLELKKAKRDVKDVSKAGLVKDGSKNLEPFTIGLVADYISKVCPSLGQQFKNDHFLRFTDGYTLEEVVTFYQWTKELDGKKGRKLSRKRLESRYGSKRRTIKLNHFSTEEDEVILQKWKEGGATFQHIGTLLNRERISIYHRLQKLLTRGAKHTNKPINSKEDFFIIDAIVDKLEDQKQLRNVVISIGSLAKSLGRPRASIMNRLENKIKVWLLSYYKGCLNLDIRAMLANYLADNFDSYGNIKWMKVLQCPEFAGHTERSLKSVYEQLEAFVKNRLKFSDRADLTLRIVAEFVNGESLKKKVKRNDEDKRIMQIVDYFEERLKSKGFSVEDIDFS